MRVMELMRVHVPTLGPRSTLRDAVDKIDLYQVSYLPVVDENARVVGAVTRERVRERLLRGGDPVREAAETAGEEIGAVMSPPFTVDETEDVVEVARRLVSHGVEHAAVTVEGRMAGTVCLLDIAQAVMMGALAPEPKE